MNAAAKPLANCLQTTRTNGDKRDKWSVLPVSNTSTHIEHEHNGRCALADLWLHAKGSGGRPPPILAGHLPSRCRRLVWKCCPQHVRTIHIGGLRTRIVDLLGWYNFATFCLWRGPKQFQVVNAFCEKRHHRVPLGTQ